MNNSHLFVADAARSRLRTIVATIDRELSRLSKPVTPDNNQWPSNGLLTSWADLVQLLALGSEPDVRECPVCKHIGMRAATLCGYCWTILSPFTESHGVVS